jgi:hypothetical protein
MNCEKDELAFIVRSMPGTPAINIGKIVKVHELEVAESRFGPIWNVEFSQPVMVTNYSQGVARMDVSSQPVTHCHYPDAFLRPIRPDAASPDSPTHAALPAPHQQEPA